MIGVGGMEIKQNIDESSVEHKLGQVPLILADIVSRPNSLNGKYKAAQIGLDCEKICNEKETLYLEGLKVKADFADKLFKEAEEQGKDTTNLSVLKNLGDEINSFCKPLHKIEAIFTAIYISSVVIIVYGIAIAFWGIAFRKSFLNFFYCGAFVGLITSWPSTSPIIVFQRVVPRAGFMSLILGIIVGIAGLVALTIRLLFFK